MSKRSADAALLDDSSDDVFVKDSHDNVSGEKVSLPMLVQRHTEEFRKMTKEKILKHSTEMYHLKQEIASKEHELRILNGKLKRTERRLMDSCQQQHIIELTDEKMLAQSQQMIENITKESNKQDK